MGDSETGLDTGTRRNPDGRAWRTETEDPGLVQQVMRAEMAERGGPSGEADGQLPGQRPWLGKGGELGGHGVADFVLGGAPLLLRVICIQTSRSPQY